ncbi:sugar phosphate isomerase/epimerase family protein [Acetobacter sp.]|jgi:sugar phosphate isomerase/epimerase|uniref:sugar phosphate isomerase/epimerase family protein n=1 Tax=Acetobacter sp. TaxID=440 RepID=UPI0025BFB7A2|nr:sugar phosphate isomerase/epimerase [Acetobacter sp.]MCH4090763.1 sugar phosphate isomerase/epimerase [Acetobacter sp.]MCI1300521.1 sugar phosphate isomerase/epimerase [Acetobacter sp.]MCI1316277.1 sugar phosphate isomerase/epimerase [Acetobacter sp.]
MNAIKGPGIFLAQFLGPDAPFNSLEGGAQWAAQLGYVGVQIPCDPRLIDLKRAAESQDYCDEIKGSLARYGIEITELSTHLQGQLIAVHPAYDALFDAFAPEAVRGRPHERTVWATEQLHLAARASRRLGLAAHATFSGSFAWPYLYPWPQRPAGLIEEAFSELGRRWKPILDTFDAEGVDLAYEVHPNEDIHDGVTFERFLETVETHPRATILYDPSHLLLQQIDYLAFLDIYHDRIRCFHVKDAEFRSNGRSGVYGGYQPWRDRAGRFRSPGDGQIDFRAIFSSLATHDYKGWAVLEWECALKDGQAGAKEGAAFILEHIIPPATNAFDDFAAASIDASTLRSLLGI